ncbi:alpha/beta hydrolase [Methylocystis sp. B8]|uniref:alpha/beta fold hydrolase n=1 Tax=Methylocystis sp. B8 TaxID=544938 RepID=UPI0010FE1DDE|nr:alpha/beta hydrolase [Methylocystis sp. B8]TLG77986.1 alpha/beta hydrolase [Methylocystis sp. B8]
MRSAATLLGARRIVVPANGIEFEIFEAGAGDRLALLLHGFPEHAVMWRHLVGPLVAVGHRVWAVNQRGYGATTRPLEKDAYSLEALTRDVAGLIDAANPTSVSLIGHDWGGFIAWVVAIRKLRRIDALVALNIPHPLCFRRALEEQWRQKFKSAYAAFFQLPWLPDRLLSARRGALAERLMQFAAGREGVFSKEEMDIYRANVSAPGAATAMLNWYRAAGSDILEAEDLDLPVDAPTLVVWGLNDVALGESCLDGIDRYVRNLRIEKLPGVSHWTPEDAPERVNALILAFLQNI